MQALRFGHIAWGFGIGDDLYFYGSTDHLFRHSYWNLPALLRYMEVPPAGNNDWWSEIGNKEQMLRTMSRGHHIRYHAYKVIETGKADPHTARSIAEELRVNGWHVGSNNCVHQTHKVLSHYGLSDYLPDPRKPAHNIIPRRWFAAIPGKKEHL